MLELITLPVVAAGIGLFVIVMYIILRTSASPCNITRLMGEEKFLVSSNQTAIDVPRTEEPASLDLSIIVPAYKETARLPVMMDVTMKYFENRKKTSKNSFTYEIIIVDDGSNDGTSEVALTYSKKFGYDLVRVLQLSKNRGKGGAVKMGMLSARGSYLLMVDADGATDIEDFGKCMTELRRVEKDNRGIVVGSRAHLEDNALAQRSVLRNLLMHGFHLLVSCLCVQGVRDTQCGFKLFTRESALLVFPTLHLERWAFDVELLYIAQCMKIPIAEVAVTWHEIDGSHLSPFWSALQMGRDLVRIRALYTLGFWKIETRSKKSQ